MKNSELAKSWTHWRWSNGDKLDFWFDFKLQIALGGCLEPMRTGISIRVYMPFVEFGMHRWSDDPVEF